MSRSDESVLGARHDVADEALGRAPTIVLGAASWRTRETVIDAVERAGLWIVGEGRTAAEVRDLALEYEPAICLLEENLPGDVVQAIHELFLALPDTHAVMLAEEADPDEAVRAIRAGADGFLLTSTNAQGLATALEALLEEEVAIPRAVAKRFVRELRHPPRNSTSRTGAPRRVVLYLPRFVKHLRRRRGSGMAFGTAWRSARTRMQDYR